MTLAALDYEAKASYSVTVTASDSGGSSDIHRRSPSPSPTWTRMGGTGSRGPRWAVRQVNNSGRIDKDELADGVFDYNIEQTLSKDDLV